MTHDSALKGMAAYDDISSPLSELERVAKETASAWQKQYTTEDLWSFNCDYSSLERSMAAQTITLFCKRCAFTIDAGSAYSLTILPSHGVDGEQGVGLCIGSGEAGGIAQTNRCLVISSYTTKPWAKGKGQIFADCPLCGEREIPTSPGAKGRIFSVHHDRSLGFGGYGEQSSYCLASAHDIPLAAAIPE